MAEWTGEQQKAIDERGNRILVSASAGSGKTAVLVARILSEILDAENPVSVDELLVMTFTRAAAAEMKKRVRDALTEAGRMDQVAILESACIQTIDSFCMNVVREYPDEIGIDPGSRIADEAELTLLQGDVMEEMLESYFASGDEDFLNFVECYTTGNAAKGLEDIILKLYRFAQSTPWPQKWYEEQLAGDGNYGEYALAAMKPDIAELRKMMAEAIRICYEERGPETYLPTILTEEQQLQSLLGADSFPQLRQRLAACTFDRIPVASKKKYDEERIAQVKRIRDFQKKRIQKLQSDLTAVDENAGIPMAIRLAQDFDRRFSEKKREKNILDFSDTEHMTLGLFAGHPEICAEYRNRFKEIYVDEYQDTNQIQEEIVAALDRGQVFMVGDVKQSIYRFRQARPEIFAEKYLQFSQGNGGEVIDLDENFRSEPEVLDSVNTLFGRIMVNYQPMRTRKERGNAPETELLLAVSGDEDTDGAELEARAIARRIHRLMRENPELHYSDIVLLLRSANTIGDIYLNALAEAGIPAYCETGKGYFDSLEIRTMTAFLTAVDNPWKEIPLTAVLHSPIIGMTDEDLVRVIGRKKKRTSVYDRLQNSENPKAMHAVELFTRYGELSKWMSIAELIECIYDETGYYAYASALPAGRTRRANLDKLLDMARSFGETGYRGLFRFLCYIDNLRAYDTDFGEAGTCSEKDDTVRIMSIHKSKGLQFPIVFLGSVSHKINQLDSAAAILADPDLGVACQYVNPELRIKQATLKQNIIKYKMRRETVAEEMRILYVAMTRAQKQLILAGTADAYAKATEKLRLTMDALSFMDWIAKDESLKIVFDEEPETETGAETKTETALPDPGNANATKDIEQTSQNPEAVNPEKEETLQTEAFAQKLQPEIRRMLFYEYPYQEDVDLRNKVSISELKKRWQIAEAIANGEILPKEESIPDITPESAGEEISDTEKKETSAGSYPAGESGFSVLSASERGTLYHSVMEHLDYADPEASYDTLDEKTKKTVRKSDIMAFVNSELGRKFQKAAAEGKLYRERQFIMGLPARETGDADSGEMVLVQGIIDAFIDDDELILIDYKTDRVDSAQTLIDRYHAQLHYYAVALEKLRGRKPDRQIIWSFALGKAIEDTEQIYGLPWTV